jgi:hypothetical protein
MFLKGSCKLTILKDHTDRGGFQMIRRHLSDEEFNAYSNDKKRFQIIKYIDTLHYLGNVHNSMKSFTHQQ